MKHLNNGHLSNDELIDHLYGISSQDSADSHVENCSECALRLGQLQGKMREGRAGAPVSHEFLSAQRRRIYARLGEPAPTRLKWAPAALAAACLLIAGLFVYRPGTTPPVHPDVADAQLFSEVYSMEQSTEPLAASPIHALFEDNQ